MTPLNFIDDTPEELNFYNPLDPLDKLTPICYDNEVRLHRQLICWVAIQKFWLYVIEEPRYDEEEIESVVNYILDMEKYNPIFSGTHLNPYSPSQRLLHNDISRYPPWVQGIFLVERSKRHMI